MIRIEFIKATDVRDEGEVIAVDENSAKWFVDEGVATYVDLEEPTPPVAAVEPGPANEPDPVVTVIDPVADPADADTVVIPTDGAYVKPETSPVIEPGE